MQFARFSSNEETMPAHDLACLGEEERMLGYRIALDKGGDVDGAEECGGIGAARNEKNPVDDRGDVVGREGLARGEQFFVVCREYQSNRPLDARIRHELAPQSVRSCLDQLPKFARASSSAKIFGKDLVSENERTLREISIETGDCLIISRRPLEGPQTGETVSQQCLSAPGWAFEV